jgi:hypothetical protein
LSSTKNATFTRRIFLINPAVVIAAVLLCLAAVSKNLSGCVGCPQYCIGGSCSLHLAIATLELLVGAIAFARSSSRIVWLTMLGVYLAFATWNIALVWNEHTSCGCFGLISVSPWFVLVLDIVVLFLIVNSSVFTVSLPVSLSICSKVFGILASAVFLVVWFTFLAANIEQSGWPVKRIGSNVYVDILKLKKLSAEPFFKTFGVDSISSESKWIILVGSCDHCVDVAKAIDTDVKILVIAPDESLTFALKK